MAIGEKVLVIPRERFERAGTFHGLTFDVDRYLAGFFEDDASFFMSRDAAETDPTHKQLIPYVIMGHGGRVLTYVRGKRAGETRLVSKRSIGIGGHINPADDMPLFGGNMRETYANAVEREVAEEVAVEGGHRDRIVALINDDSTEVGRVHLGIVHCWELEKPSVTRREQMITQLEFLSIPELQKLRDSMETWSQMCLDRLDEIASVLA